MRSLLNRIRRAPWTYRQPLTALPRVAAAPVSDLFVWRRSGDWRTFFELTDMPGIYEESTGTSKPREALLLVLDHNGMRIAETRLKAPLHERRIVDISGLVPGADDAFGTFCVFHAHTPDAISALGSHLAERGYVSFSYRDAALRGYVHGNLDAVALGPGASIELLGGSGVLHREYRLQHELRAPCEYELVIVNPNSASQQVECEILRLKDGVPLERLSASLQPGGSHVFRFSPAPQERARAIFRSRLVMARPLIFRLENQGMDVLHG
jgi:hypothetical protein